MVFLAITQLASQLVALRQTAVVAMCGLLPLLPSSSGRGMRLTHLRIRSNKTTVSKCIAPERD
jgi:hypothetical protein